MMFEKSGVVNAMAADSYEHEFVVLNKSYAKDLKWAVALYRSWRRFAKPLTPYFVIVPKSDVLIFKAAFAEYTVGDCENLVPFIESEEWLFNTAKIDVPPTFGGWHRQQVVKLCFAKSGMAKQYVTLDSSMVFTKAFDYRVLLAGTQICTAAGPVRREDFFKGLRESGEQGWLNGGLVGIDRCFDAISTVLENKTELTHRYISCSGLFDSELSCELERYAFEKGVNGFIGLLEIAPYEFAWYGEYVFTKHPDRFRPLGPDLMTLAHSVQDAHCVEFAEFNIQDAHFGAMFQPPASEILDPEIVFHRLTHR